MAFHVGDYLKSILQFTTRQHGAYLLLILACWQGGGSVAGDDATLATIARLTPRDWRRDRPKLAACFEVTPRRWTHRRVVHELAEARAHMERRSRSGKLAARKRWQSERTATRMPDALPDPLPDLVRNDAPSPSQERTPSGFSPHESDSSPPVAARATGLGGPHAHDADPHDTLTHDTGGLIATLARKLRAP